MRQNTEQSIQAWNERSERYVEVFEEIQIMTIEMNKGKSYIMKLS